MTSLTETAILARKIIRYGFYAVILLIVARILFAIGTSAYRLIFPKQPPKPTVAFGKLPVLTTPQQSFPDGYTFDLQTADAALPAFPTQLPVYEMAEVTPTLRALDDAKQIVGKLGFNTAGTKLVDTVYVFPSNIAASKLTYNIANGVFSISYDLAADPSAVGAVPPSTDRAAAIVKSYLSQGSVFPDDLNGPVTGEYQKIEGGQRKPAISQSEADIVKVNLFRKPMTEDEIPAVTPKFTEANVWFALSGAQQREKQFILAEYHYFPLNEDKSSTYPIKTAQQAWEDLKNGKAYIAHFPDDTSNKVTIRRVYLAYYDAGQYSKYYQPVVVLEGDSNFAAFVPAVTNDYYGAAAE